MRWTTILCLTVLPLCARQAPAQTPPPAKTLEECVQLAVENHPSIKAAQATIEAGKQRVWQAASNYLPQVNANYSANRRMTSITAATGTSTGTQVGTIAHTFNFYNSGFSLSQILFDFGQTLDQIRSAQAAEASLQADEVTQQDTVVFNLKQSYFNVLAAKRLLGVADETIRQDQKHLEQAQGRFDVGFAPKFDVTQAKVQLAQAELNQVTARNNVLVARATLGNALGLTGPPPFEIVDTFDTPPLHIGMEDALNRAYASRPELQSLLAQQQALDAQIAALEKQYLPNVSGNAQYYWAGNFAPLQDNWNVGASVNVSIFNGGLTTAQVGEAKANLATLRFNTDVERQSIALQVRQAVLDLQQADESIGVARKALEQARENLELASGRYDTGVGNIIELTDAQTSLTSAEASYVQAVYNYKIAAAAVERAIGQTLPS
jgi:outer membrane protein